MNYSDIDKAVDYFGILGVNNKLQETGGKILSRGDVITNLELIDTENYQNNTELNPGKTKIINFDGLDRLQLRISYGGDEAPITDINLYEMKQSSGGMYVSIPEKHGIMPVIIKKNADTSLKVKKKLRKDAIVYGFYGDFDLSKYLNIDNEDNRKILCLCLSRRYEDSPISNIEFIEIQDNLDADYVIIQNPEMKVCPYKFIHPTTRFLCYETSNIFEKKFVPQILSKYPESRLYYSFPDNISSFLFTDFKLEKVDENIDQQTPKFDSFILTDSDGYKIFCCGLTFKENLLYPELKSTLEAYNINDPKTVLVPKSIGIISHYGFTDTFKELLKCLFSIHFSKTSIPIERFVGNLVDEVPVPDKDNTLVEYKIGNTTLPFYRPGDQYAPYASGRDIEYTFKCLDYMNVIKLVLNLSLENKILLVSRYKPLLSCVSTTLTSFLAPFKWMHVLIPFLPSEMSQVIEGLFPFIIGIERKLFDKMVDDIPYDVIIVDLDENDIQNHDEIPKIPAKDFDKLSSKLEELTKNIFIESQDDRVIELGNIENAFDFNTKSMLSDYSLDESDHLAIREAFLALNGRFLYNFEKYIIPLHKIEGIATNAMDGFKFDQFRQYKESFNHDYFYKLSQTSLFSAFIEDRVFKDTDVEKEIEFFDKAIKTKKKKKDARVLTLYEPGRKFKALEPFTEDILIIGLGKKWTYTTFPVLDERLFGKPRKTKSFIKSKDFKWKTDNKIAAKMNDTEWFEFGFETIFNVWVYTMSLCLPKYQEDSAKILSYSKSVIEFLKYKVPVIRENEFIYQRLFEACMKCKLHDEAIDIKDENKSINFIFLDRSSNSFIPTDTISSMGSAEEEKRYETHNPLNFKLFDVTISSANQCANIDGRYQIKEEEIVNGWLKDLEQFETKCPIGNIRFVPKLKVITEYQDDQVNSINFVEWLPPGTLLKNFINCTAQKREHILQNELELFLAKYQLGAKLEFNKSLVDGNVYQSQSKYSQLYWNLVFYFRLMKLPEFFLDIGKNRLSLDAFNDIGCSYNPLFLGDKLHSKASVCNSYRKSSEFTRDSTHFDISYDSIMRRSSVKSKDW